MCAMSGLPSLVPAARDREWEKDTVANQVSSSGNNIKRDDIEIVSRADILYVFLMPLAKMKGEVNKGYEVCNRCGVE